VSVDDSFMPNFTRVGVTRRSYSVKNPNIVLWEI